MDSKSNKHFKDILSNNNIPKITVLKRWHINPRFLLEKGMLKTNNLNISNRIFQRNSLSPFLFGIALITLSIELKNTDKK